MNVKLVSHGERCFLVLFLLTTLTTSSIYAGSYQRTDGTIVDPIMHQGLGSPHPYGGHLEPNANRSNIELPYANLFSADLHGADLSETNLRYADLANADLSDATLYRTDLRDTNLTNANLYDAEMRYAWLHESDLTDANLQLTNLANASFSKSNLTNANLSDTTLNHAYLLHANLTNADLSGAHMHNAVVASANLTDADLSNVSGGQINFRSAKLYDTNLSNAAVGGSNMTDTDLTGANLYNADLSGTDLTNTKLRFTNLTWAQMSAAKLFGTQFYTDTILMDGQTVAQHGFNVGSLTNYMLMAVGNEVYIDGITISTGLAGDFNNNEIYDQADIGRMFQVGDLEIGVPTSVTTDRFDLVDNDTIDAADITEWLSQAAAANGHGSGYLRGDTDLDRDIDLTDYNALVTNFDPIGTYGPYLWQHGNFDGNGNVDLSDYNALASNFQPLGYGAAAVPEPTSLCLLLTALLVLARVRF